MSDREQANTDEKKQAAKTAVESAGDSEQKKEVAAAALDALSSKDRKDLLKGMWPGDSGDRALVYVAGFIVAGAVAVWLAFIAAGNAGDRSGVSASLIVLATGFSSAMLGGLLGAYIQR